MVRTAAAGLSVHDDAPGRHNRADDVTDRCRSFYRVGARLPGPPLSGRIVMGTEVAGDPSAPSGAVARHLLHEGCTAP
jgi:hypothetical protein